MADYVLVRTNGGEVTKITDRQDFADSADSTYFTVLTNPSLPDGRDIQEQLPDGSEGPKRQFGFAKYGDIPGNIVRNATQQQIDAWPAAFDADEAKRDRGHADNTLRFNPIWRKILRAFYRTLRPYLNNPPNMSTFMSEFRSNFRDND